MLLYVSFKPRGVNIFYMIEKWIAIQLDAKTRLPTHYLGKVLNGAKRMLSPEMSYNHLTHALVEYVLNPRYSPMLLSWDRKDALITDFLMT